MALRWCGSVRVAMTGPRWSGSLWPHTIGLGRGPNGLGCEVKTMCFWPFFLSGINACSLQGCHTHVHCLCASIVYAQRSSPASFHTHDNVITDGIGQRTGGNERRRGGIRRTPMGDEVLEQGVLLRPEAPQVTALIEQSKPDRPMHAGEDHPCESGYVAQCTGFHDGVNWQMPAPDGATIDASHRKDIGHRQ